MWNGWKFHVDMWQMWHPVTCPHGLHLDSHSIWNPWGRVKYTIQPPVIGWKCPYYGYVAHFIVASKWEKEPGNEESTCHHISGDQEWHPWAELDKVWMQALFYGGFWHVDRVFILILNYECSQVVGPDPMSLKENTTLNAFQYVVLEGPMAYPLFVKVLGWDQYFAVPSMVHMDSSGLQWTLSKIHPKCIFLGRVQGTGVHSTPLHSTQVWI